VFLSVIEWIVFDMEIMSGKWVNGLERV